jgi:DNA-binding ferritin-like protein (Dps family)
MDFRVIHSLGWEQPSAYNFDFWQKYCRRIRAIAKKFRLPMRAVDKALWKYDEINSGKRKMCKQ